MKKYLIKKGKHSSGFHFGFTFRNSIRFRAKFDKSCLYTIKGIDKYDINKLFGFSTTWYLHRQSARVGWRCLDGKTIQLITYSYHAGLREPQEMDILGVVNPDEKFECDIIDLERSYLYKFKILNSLENIVVYEDAKKPDWFFFHYFLYPYFGGNKTAPHDMKIYLEIL